MRNVALIILTIPACVAALGIKLMRDTFFGISNLFPYLWLQFCTGLFLFVLGIAFITGFFFFREQKKRQKQRNPHTHKKA